jgi:hypothetical protein
MFRCPHCEKPGISILRKTVLSPGQIATCNACEGASGLRYPAWISGMIPGSMLMIAAMFVDSAANEWLLNIIGIVLMIVVPLLFAPLHPET